MKRLLLLLVVVVSLFGCGEIVIVEPEMVEQLNESVEIGVSDNGDILFAHVRIKNDIPNILFYSRNICFIQE